MIEDINDDLVAERMRSARLRAGFATKVAAAEASGLGDYRIQEYEKGRNRPRAEALVILAQLYQCSIDYLLGLTDDPRSANELAASAESASGNRRTSDSGRAVLDRSKLNAMLASRNEREFREFLEWKPQPFVLGLHLGPDTEIVESGELEAAARDAWTRLATRYPKLLQEWLGRKCGDGY